MLRSPTGKGAIHPRAGVVEVEEGAEAGPEGAGRNREGTGREPVGARRSRGGLGWAGRWGSRNKAGKGKEAPGGAGAGKDGQIIGTYLEHCLHVLIPSDFATGKIIVHVVHFAAD